MKSKQIHIPGFCLATVFIFMLPFWNKCYAQVDFEADSLMAKEAKTKTFIVVMKEISEKEKNKKIKKGTYDETKKYVESQNAHLDSIFRKYWVLNKNIVSKTETELEDIIKSKNNDYVYLHLERETEQRSIVLGMNVQERRTCVFGYYIFTLKFTGNNKEIASVSSRGPSLNDIDYINAILLLQNMVRISEGGVKSGKMNAVINQKAGTLKSKTLLLSQSLTKLTVNEIEKTYPFPFKISNDNEIIEKIAAGDDQFTYAAACHKKGGCGTRFHYFIINCRYLEPVLFEEAGSVGILTKKELTTWYESNALWQDSEGNYSSQLSPNASVITTDALHDFEKRIIGE